MDRVGHQMRKNPKLLPSLLRKPWNSNRTMMMQKKITTNCQIRGLRRAANMLCSRPPSEKPGEGRQGTSVDESVDDVEGGPVEANTYDLGEGSADGLVPARWH